ncbi:hypothetical protein [Mastigocladopsis repens]|uniref:hypothetical protein n=1 Tax=Mastigocladopsis repens TaxID=221287 RepID=UPI00030CB74F|nr:hypothetical protein [Mastigocladopsis repens]
MSIGYWTHHTPGDGSYLELLQEKYGAQLEGINKREKLYLITSVASHLYCTIPDREARNEIQTVAQEIPTQLSVCDQEGLIEALINQVRHSRPAITDVSLLKQENNPF